MKTDLSDFRSIELLEDEKHNIVIFPVSKSDKLLDDGINYEYHTAYYPIELNYPYKAEDLADKIKEGIDLWNKYPCFNQKNTFEEKYYEIKGFKNAVFGKKYISLGWNDFEGKYISLMLPLKRGYGYMGIETISLKEDANYLDYSNAVIDLLNLDIAKHARFKLYKKMLNI